MPFTRGNKKFTLRIPDPLASRITDLANETDKTPSEVIRQAVKEYFRNLDNETVRYDLIRKALGECINDLDQKMLNHEKNPKV